MIFQHTWQRILNGSKRKTRRLVKDSEGWTSALSFGIVGKDRGKVVATVPSYSAPRRDFKNIYSIFDRDKNREVYAVGKQYPVQSGRGKPMVWWRRNEDGGIVYEEKAIEYIPSFNGYHSEVDYEQPVRVDKRVQLIEKGYKPLRFVIESICYDEDVRTISDEEAVAEGFHDKVDFWDTWVEMHDRGFYSSFQYAADKDYLEEYGFFSRPSNRYRAWVLTFEIEG